MARKQYPLRIDPEIWAAVQRWADDEMRSANGQVEWILRDALKRYGRLPKKGAAEAAGNAGDAAAADPAGTAPANAPAAPETGA